MKLWIMANSNERIRIVPNGFYYSNIRNTEESSFLNLGKQHGVTYRYILFL